MKREHRWFPSTVVQMQKWERVNFVSECDSTRGTDEDAREGMFHD